MNSENIRNFSIIAHIDHGKSTLADRLIEITNTVNKRDLSAQCLDNMDLERERGITIKSHAIRMEYTAKNGELYSLNLIDTPGHVDFAYEVSRALAACEGALLIVDASQGIEAQTFSNLYKAIDADLDIVPVLNKIDLPAARPEEIGLEVADLLGCDPDDVIKISAKNGINIEAVLEAIVAHIPAPKGERNKPVKSLIFDSYFDKYRGVVIYVRVMEGVLRRKDVIKFFTHDETYEIEELGYLRMDREPQKELKAGEIGYIIANVKEIHHAKVGDTITTLENAAIEALEGYQDVKPMVYSGIYPIEGGSYDELKEALGKLSLNDASFVYEPEVSDALGHGFRAGFLGLLHMEIVQERLEREFNCSVISTIPSVKFEVIMKTGKEVVINNPDDLPDLSSIDYIKEPFIKATLLTHIDYIGAVMKLCQEKRGIYMTTTYIDDITAELHYELPLAEVVLDFFDKLKSVSSGYASFDYEYMESRRADMVKLDILINGEPVDAFSVIIHRDKSYYYGRELTNKLKGLIPKHLFDIAIQAAIGAKIISRSSISARRKDVLAKCYGGDISRKKKLLNKQKEGKKRMKQIGSVDVPQEAFLAVLKIDDQ